MSSKNKILLALVLASFISGAVDQYFYPGVLFPPTALLAAVTFLLLIFAWYRLDATEIGYKRTRSLNVGVVALGVLALPYYFFRSRGAKGGAIATLAMLLLFVACNFVMNAGTYAAYYGLQS